MLQHLLVAWRSGLRSRSFQALFILGLLAMGGSYLAAEFSGRQPATVALDVGLSAIRIIGLLLVLFWTQELIAREVERRTVFSALAYPAPRSAYLLGRYLGLLLLTAAAVVLLGLLLLGTVHIVAGGYQQSQPIYLGWEFWLTLLYSFLDLAAVAAFALFITSLSTTPLLPFALGFAFALAGRSLGPVLEYLFNQKEVDPSLAHTFQPILDIVRWILPDLSRLDIRPLTLYGQWPGNESMLWPAVMALGYLAILLAAAVLIFKRREFA